VNERKEFISCFREVQPKFSRLCSRSLAGLHMTLPQFALLNLVADAGTIPMTEASEKLHISKPAVTHLMDRLEENHFLRRVDHPKDRRVSLIQILPKGKKVVTGMQATMLGILLKALTKFTLQEQKVIRQFYALLSRTIDADLTKEK
jgi:DNA-binding MarR family transcriptional regulator